MNSGLNLLYRCNNHQQEAQLMLTTGSTRLAVSRGQQSWYHSTLHIASYCAIVTLSFTIFVFKKIHDLEMGVKGHSRSLRVLSFDRLCMVSY